MTTFVLAAAAVLLGVLAFGAHRSARRRRREAKVVASELVPEIRGILSASEGGGEPRPPRAFPESRHRLARLFGKEALFAVETFYQVVEAYREASRVMQDAFSETSDSSLGDRIRAKDRRDRCLKDVFYSGEAAIERLKPTVD